MTSLRTHNNFELLKKGDPAALANIYNKYRRQLFWMGKKTIDDEFVIESILQNTFLKLWEKKDGIERPEHIFFFLLFVMRRDCTYYYTRPKNKFYRNIGRLEYYENYQIFMHGYDPEEEDEHLLGQEADQKAFDRVSHVIPLLTADRRRLIELCLKYGFQYKTIAQLMGNSITYTSNEVKRAIEDIKKIIHQGSNLDSKPKPMYVKIRGKITEKQEKVLQLRKVRKYSFAAIAEELNLSQKEVHREFMAAYKLLQFKHEQQQSA